jgi:hypothetical protein
MVKGFSRRPFYEGKASCFLNAEYPFNVVPEGDDNEGKPRMGKWYAFLQVKKRAYERW